MSRSQAKRIAAQTGALPSFVCKRIEAAIDEALHPQGMSTHRGTAVVQAADLQYLLAALDAAAQTERAAVAGRLRALAEEERHAQPDAPDMCGTCGCDWPCKPSGPNYLDKGELCVVAKVLALADELDPPQGEGGNNG